MHEVWCEYVVGGVLMEVRCVAVRVCLPVSVCVFFGGGGSAIPWEVRHQDPSP